MRDTLCENIVQALYLAVNGTLNPGETDIPCIGSDLAALQASVAPCLGLGVPSKVSS